jgi:hypothetical protein
MGEKTAADTALGQAAKAVVALRGLFWLVGTGQIRSLTKRP